MIKLNFKKHSIFYLSLILISMITGWIVFFNENFMHYANIAFNFVTHQFGWLYLLAMVVFLVFLIYLLTSKYGDIRLGKDTDRPEYSNISWFGLLFGCGMGVGLLFWGVAEPLSHYLTPPEGIAPHSADSLQFSMRSFFMHWGIVPWACYAVIGLSLAYFMFRKGKKCLISPLIESLIGEKLAKGWLGKWIDILAVVATVTGIVTSLGLGALQINAGLHYLFGVPINLIIKICIIVVAAILFIGTAVSGLDQGMKKLSDLNLYLAFALLVLCFIVGPKVPILNSFVDGIGQYLTHFVPDLFHINAYDSNQWLEKWRLFYWAWFIAWAPFVGIFIARISKGRTIREFILGVVLVPTIASCIWGCIFGNLGIHLAESHQLSTNALQKIIATPEVGLFAVLKEYPLGFILAIMAIISLCTFFITSANSGVYVISMLTSDGDMNPKNYKQIIWGIIQAIIAIGLIIAGGLKPLQMVTLLAAFPFIFILFSICLSFIKTIHREEKKE